MDSTRSPGTPGFRRAKPAQRDPDLNSLGAGDSYLVQNFLPGELGQVAFDKLKEEVGWNVMKHRGGEVPRRVAVEGEVLEDGSFPLYRHPADESPRLLPFSATVAAIREHVQKVLKHPVNHVLIQHYRSGADYISEHSDKTVDVVKGSSIVNVSLGAQRVMTLRTKKDQLKGSSTSTPASEAPAPLAEGGTGTSGSGTPEPTARLTQRIPLPHNSMFVMGLETNKKWLHGINHDNRPFNLKSEEEKFMNGERISLTFRWIGTFLTKDETRIFGQGAKGKTPETAGPVINGGTEAEKLIIAFGDENHSSEFDWHKGYGEGSDVLHFVPSN